jgi:hypothetical protein
MSRLPTPRVLYACRRIAALVWNHVDASSCIICVEIKGQGAGCHTNIAFICVSFLFRPVCFAWRTRIFDQESIRMAESSTLLVAYDLLDTVASTVYVTRYIQLLSYFNIQYGQVDFTIHSLASAVVCFFK